MGTVALTARVISCLYRNLDMFGKIVYYVINTFRSTVTIRVIMFVRLLVGLYYNISSRTPVRLAARAYCGLCFILCLKYYFFILQLSANNPDYTLFLMDVVVLCSYSLIVVINFIYDGEYFLQFRDNILDLDISLNIQQLDDIKISKLIFVVILVQKLCGAVNYCIFIGSLCSEAIISVFVTSFIRVSIAVSIVTHIMLFESVYHRMKLLRKRFERDLSVVRRFEDGEHAMTENLYTCMYIYKTMLHTVEVSNTPMKIMVNIQNIFNSLKSYMLYIVSYNIGIVP